MTRKPVGLWVLLICALSACGHGPATDIPPTVRTIHISDVVEPQVLLTTAGEEIRWQDLRSNPVHLGFLTMRLLDELGCAKGLTTLLGRDNDLATIPPGESISLCFVRSGKLTYNVWLNAGNPKGAMSRTAATRVEKQG